MKIEQQTLYVSPQVKTVEIKAQQVLCQSNPDSLKTGGLDYYEGSEL